MDDNLNLPKMDLRHGIPENPDLYNINLNNENTNFTNLAPKNPILSIINSTNENLNIPNPNFIQKNLLLNEIDKLIA